MKKTIIFFAIVILTSGQILSQGSAGVSDARSTGMGRTFVTSSNGLYAVGGNPANIFQGESSNKFELILPLPIPTVSARLGTDFFSLNDYNYFFGQSYKDEKGNDVGRLLTESDKNRLKDLFSNGGNIFSDVKINWFGIALNPSASFGTVAFTISDNISTSATLPKDIVALGIDGNLINRVYNFNDTKLKAWWLRKYSMTYARELNILPVFRQLSFGLSLNIVQGFAYVGIDNVKTELKTDANNVITGKGDFTGYSSFSTDFGVKYDFDSLSVKKDTKVSPFPESAGSGVGFDFGFRAKVNDVMSVGFAITDIGSVKWTKNVAEFKSDNSIYLDDITDKGQRDSLVDNLTGKGSGRYIGEITTSLATALHIGCSLQIDKMLNGNFPGTMLVALDYHQGFNDQPSNTTVPRFSLGAEWSPINLLAFRSGFTFGGLTKFGWAAGLGFNFNMLELNFGTPDMQYVLAPNSAKRITVAFDSRWKF